MSRLIAQIMLAILLLPLAALVYAITFIVFYEMQRGVYYPSRDEAAMMAAGIVAWAFIACYWILLWRQSVAWTGTRVSRTALCFGAALLGGVTIGAMLGAVTDQEDVAMFFGSAASPLLWVVATILVWRETDAERAARVSKAGLDQLLCPTCGYNLTGLKGTRCPECGSEFTLDALLAAQPARRQAEVEG